MNAKTPEQLAREASQRAEENAEAVIGATEDMIDNSRPAPVRQGQDDSDPLEGGTVRREPIARSPQDDIRNSIASRFRRAEPTDERPFNGDMSDSENIYGEVGADEAENENFLTDEELDAQAEARERGEAQPERAKPKPTTLKEDVGAEDDTGGRMITRMVRGKPVTMTENEWLDKATQVTAADMYLAESRAILEQAKDIRAGRASRDDQHPDRSTERGDDGLDRSDPVEQAQHPELSFKDVIQEIQYGDPDEAAAKLEKLVEARSKKTATATVTEGALQRSYDQDLARSQKELKAFAEANPDLAADEIAAMAIERGMYRLYEEDMLALGLEKDQLPKTPKELANWHRFYRINGYEVRPTKQLLEASKESFVKWRDGKSEPRQQQTPSRQQPRIQVNVDRDQRRMAIPVQPHRAVTPRRDAQPTTPTSRSDVVANMRRARGQL